MYEIHALLALYIYTVYSPLSDVRGGGKESKRHAYFAAPAVAHGGKRYAAGEGILVYLIKFNCAHPRVLYR